MKLLLPFFIVILSFTACKRVPTFSDIGANEPTSPDYSVRAPNQFQVIPVYSSRTAYFHINYPSTFPYSGFEVEVKDETSNDDFAPFTTYIAPISANDSLFYLEIPDIPYTLNEFKIQAFYDSDKNGRLYSEPMYAHLRQFLFGFTYQIEEYDTTALYWSNNFMAPFHLTMIGGSPPNTLLQQNTYPGNMGYLDADTSMFLNSNTVSYTTSMGQDSSNAIATNFSVNFSEQNCIETRGEYYLFNPPSLAVSFSSRNDEITFSWTEDCDIDQVIVLRDDGAFLGRKNTAYPMVEIARKQLSSGFITAALPENYTRIYNQIWLVAIYKGKQTELRAPYNYYF